MNFFKPKFWDKNQISFFSILLFPIALLIKFLAYLKSSWTKTYSSSIPIICVGNIYLGGTGKTPLCIEIFSILKKLNMNPAFVRKKYNSFQDEVDLMKQVGPTYQNQERIDAIKDAIKNNANIAILDDGFQDFSIKKNLSIVCFNEKQWIGNGLTIPAGPLREDLSALKRADCVFINGKKNKDIENKIFSKNGEIKIFYVSYKLQNANEFKNKKVVAFAGIGNSQNFFDLIEKNNIEMVSMAFWTVLKLAGPVLIVALVVGLTIGIIQAATSINEMTLSFVPKVVIVILTIAIFTNYLLTGLTDYFMFIFERVATLR